MERFPDHAPLSISRRRRWLWGICGVLAGILLSALSVELVVRFFLPQVRYSSAPRVRLAGLPPCSPPVRAFWSGFCGDPRTDTQAEFSDEEIKDAGEPTLRGWWVPPSGKAARAVIFIHGAGSDRREGLKFVQTVRGAGWGLLLVDLRNHGMSDNDGQGITYGVNERFDVLRAAEWLRREKGITSVVTLGISMGGASAIMAAARDTTHLIDGVIAECPYASIPDVLVGQAQARSLPASLGLRVMEELRNTMGRRTLSVTPAGAAAAISPRPFLIVIDGADTLIPPWHGEVVFDEAHEPRQRLDLPTATHAQGFNAAPAEYARAIVELLERVKHVPPHAN